MRTAIQKLVTHIVRALKKKTTSKQHCITLAVPTCTWKGTHHNLAYFLTLPLCRFVYNWLHTAIFCYACFLFFNGTDAYNNPTQIKAFLHSPKPLPFFLFLPGAGRDVHRKCCSVYRNTKRERERETIELAAGIRYYWPLCTVSLHAPRVSVCFYSI